jgi:hypothetical protein
MTECQKLSVHLDFGLHLNLIHYVYHFVRTLLFDI